MTVVALEAVGFAFLGAGLAAVGSALVAGQTDWRLILGAALIAGLAKVFPSQIIPSPENAPAPVQGPGTNQPAS